MKEGNFRTDDEDDVVPVVRVRATVAGEENCYVLIGKGFCDVKFPDENKHELKGTKKIVKAICEAVVTGMERLEQQNADTVREL